jgi:cation:H+ antiporter
VAKSYIQLMLGLGAATGSLLLVLANVLSNSLLYLVQAILLVSVVYLIAIGAEWLVDGATGLAGRLRIPKLVVGLTVVAFGTSSPEMAASLVAGFQGNGDIAVANIVGSNIFNLCFILGGVALLVRGGLPVNRRLALRDGPVMMAGVILTFLFLGGFPGGVGRADGSPDGFISLLDFRLERGEGLILFVLLIIYLVALYRFRQHPAEITRPTEATRKNADSPPPPDAARAQGIVAQVALLLVGLGLVLGGCHVLVGHADASNGVISGYGTLWFARQFGIPDYIIGVTIIAAGTSAPEFVVSLVAALRKSVDISTGNLLGSVIFNLFGVLGVAGLLVQPPLGTTIAVSNEVTPSLAALLVVLMATIFIWTGKRITRFEGLLLVLAGVAFWIWDLVIRS